MPRRELNAGHQSRVKAAAAAHLRSEWSETICHAVNAIGELYYRLQVYHELMAVVAQNTATYSPPVLVNWLQENFYVAMCMGIRRLTDLDERSASVGRVLREMELRCDAVNRDAYRSIRLGQHIAQNEADDEWARQLGACVLELPTAVVTAEIDQLEAADEAVRRLVNKRLAHHEPLTAVAMRSSQQVWKHDQAAVRAFFLDLMPST